MVNSKKKFFIVTTVPQSLKFFKGQLSFLSDFFQITAISSNKESLNKFGKEEGVKTYCIPMQRHISLLRDMLSLIRFMYFFYREKPYFVHANTPKGSFLSMVSAKLMNTPVRVYMCHGLRYVGYEGLMRNLLKMMECLTCYCATEVICVSSGVKQILIEDRICKKKKLKVIGYGSANGIDLVLFDRNNVNPLKLPMTGVTSSDFIFCFVGRIVKDKGVNELVAAFKQLNNLYVNTKLFIVGPFENNENPIAEITKAEIKSNSGIVYWGKQEDVRPFICMSDIFVLPSYREGFGMVLIEAAALGVPCIATNVTGCNEIIQDGVNGRIIPPRDVSALYETMKWTVEHRDNDVKEMAKRARTMIVERYEQHKVWNALLEEYQALINR